MATKVMSPFVELQNSKLMGDAYFSINLFLIEERLEIHCPYQSKWCETRECPGSIVCVCSSPQAQTAIALSWAMLKPQHS